jgi:uncharacterized LabA/DUF88 family protein
MVAFFDGQNLFKAAEQAFNVTFPDYDPMLLAREVCKEEGWELAGVRFYTGVHAMKRNAHWHGFWSKKLAHLGKQGATVFRRNLRYHRQEVKLRGGSFSHDIAVEKGIDVRIAIDLIKLAIDQAYDVGVIFSQDQDLSEAAAEVKQIAVAQKCAIELFSAYPISTTRRSETQWPINHTEAIEFEEPFYDRCRDKRDYLPPRP